MSFVVACAGALIWLMLSAAPAFAQSATVTLADGVWSGATGPSGTPSCLVYSAQANSTSDNNTVVYGSSTPTGCNAPQSGFGFDGIAPPNQNVSFNQAFLLGQFVHFNNPVYAARGMSSVVLTVKLSVIINGVTITTDFVYTYNLEETPNSGTCTYPSTTNPPTPCPDRVTIANSVPAQTFTVGGVPYTLQLLGFAPGTTGSCSYVEGATVSAYVTEERQDNYSCLFGRIVAPTNVDLGIVKSGPSTPTPGSTITYNFDVTNLGPANATNVVVSDVLNKNLNFVSGSGCTAVPASNSSFTTAQTVTCVIAGTMAPGNPPTPTRLSINVATNPNFSGAIDNLACVSGAQTDASTTNNCDAITSTTPVSVAYFEAAASPSGTTIQWSTATEMTTVGYNLFVDSANGRMKVNNELIPVAVVSSMTPRQYRFETTIPGTTFYLQDVDIFGVVGEHGPFELGQRYGVPASVEPIQWDALRAEHEAKSDEQDAEAIRQTSAILAQLGNDHTATAGGAASGEIEPQYAFVEDVYTVFLPFAASDTSLATTGSVEAAAVITPLVKLTVNQTGLYRVTYSQLLAAGFDLSNIRSRFIGLINRDNVALQLQVVSPRYFRPSATIADPYIEFYGTALDTIYTGENVYRIVVDPSLALALRVGQNMRPGDMLQPAASFYRQTTTIEDNKAYSFITPTPDPWYDTQFFVRTTSNSWDFALPVSNYVQGASQVKLSISLWGASEWAGIANNHHVQLAINGTSIPGLQFGGVQNVDVTLHLSPTHIINGVNTLQVTLPGDSGAGWDIVNLDSYAIEYPRAPVAVDGKLALKVKGKRIQVDGLPSNDLLVYKFDRDRVVKMNNLNIVPNGGSYSVSFVGINVRDVFYYVTTKAMLMTPQISALQTANDLLTGPANLLVISHPDFISGIAPLVAARTAQGINVKVVNVQRLYDAYTGGVFDADAIHLYVKDAVSAMGVQSVLLVGSDSYDYRNFGGTNSISFVPSLYVRTGPEVGYGFVPADPLMVDLDGDKTPDLPIGRLPVRSQAELNTFVAKILAYDGITTYGKTAVFAADSGFKNDAEAVRLTLPSGWTTSQAYLDDMSVAAAKTTLVDAINNGVALVSYTGHSGPTVWTYEGLFGLSDAAALTNAGKPTVITQWGCFSSYYVDPVNNTLAHAFTAAGQNGAAALLGSSTISFAASERELGLRLTPKLAQSGKTIGAALQEAKDELFATYPSMTDAIIGWTILGDPTMKIAQ